jgi:class 3 adenylate cyclase/DNA-binding beta-propeller fold protein YncE
MVFSDEGKIPPGVPAGVRLSAEAPAWQTRAVPKANETRLRAVLFTDVVSSTELAREMGDVRWSRLLEAQRRVIRRLLRSSGGREVDTAGDGFFAVFDRTADAVRCAFAACREVQELGLDIRAGVHVGEVELAGHEVHGIVVHTGARVMGQAGASEVLVTATVKDLVAGARFDLRERGTVELKGVPGMWTLYDVMAVDDQLRPAPIEQASVASERRDRVASSPTAGRRSRRWIVPAAAVAVIVAVVAVYAITRPTPTFVPTPGTVARIDPSGRFDEPVPLASVPTAIAWGEGMLWVADQRGQVYWLDPETGESGSRGAAGVPTGLAVGDGAVWVTNGFGVGDGPDGGVSRIDPVSESLEPAFATPTGSEAIAWGANRVWVTDTGTGEVQVYDPVAHEIEPVTLPSGSGPPPRPEQIVVGPRGDVVWVGDAAAGRVFRVSATSPSTTDVETFTVTTPVTGLAVSEDGVWVTGGADDRITLLDAETGAVVTSLDVAGSRCNQPEGITAGSGAIWVTCSASRTLLRIDPDTRTAADPIVLDGAPAALTTDADGAVWVAVRPA